MYPNSILESLAWIMDHRPQKKWEARANLQMGTHKCEWEIIKDYNGIIREISDVQEGDHPSATISKTWSDIQAAHITGWSGKKSFEVCKLNHTCLLQWPSVPSQLGLHIPCLHSLTSNFWRSAAEEWTRKGMVRGVLSSNGNNNRF